MILLVQFYLILSLIIIISACFVVFLNNPIYCLLSLVLTFIFSGIFLLVLGCEFLALMFIIIYVGAIAVLFLFIVMLLDLKFKNFQQKKNYSFGSALFFGNLLLIFLVFLSLNCFKYDFIFLNFNFINRSLDIQLNKIFPYFIFYLDKSHLNYLNWKNFSDCLSETQLYSSILYDIFIIQLLLVGLVLLSVLIGIVYLTNCYKSSEILDQSVFKQISVSSNFFLKH